MVSIRKVKQTGFKLRTKKRNGGPYNAELVGLIVAGLCIGFLMVFLYTVAFSEASVGESRGIPEALRKTKKHPVLMETTEESDAENGDGNNVNGEDPNHPPIKHVRPMGDGMNAIALDILGDLDCVNLLKEAEAMSKLGGDISRRRLQQHADDGGFAGSGGADQGDTQQEQQNDGGDDDTIPEEKWGDLADQDPEEELGDDEYPSDPDKSVDISARHLFCIAASESPPEIVTNQIACDGTNKKRKTLLELWSAARPRMQLDLMLKVLDLAREDNHSILENSYNIWAPKNDDGVMYMVNTLNSDADVDNGGLNGLEDALGPGKTFVDVGSCLGLTCLVINDKYPGTKIVSLEPASPSWLLQEINLRCNMPHKEFKELSIILGGVGANSDEEDSTMAKLMWRPTSTTSTRSWTPSTEFQEDDVELVVELHQLKSILLEARVERLNHIDVLNVDCQGCEYNMVPNLIEEEFKDIPTVMGNVHWGYIKPSKLPSSTRGRTTHQFLCGHENIARGTKECCAFLDLPVKSSVPGEVLQKTDSKGGPPRESTVSDVIADGLCDDFSTWKRDHYLDEVPDDFNWFELSSQA
jgi:FkbM family methyltransferase